MPLGAAVRKRLGSFEPVAIRLYRDRFIDLDSLAASISVAASGARRILEIGCGDGAMAGALLPKLPAAHLTGIDPVAADPGRMFDGAREAVTFEKVALDALLERNEPPFDLTLLVDVLHHVHDDERLPLLRDVGALTAPGGIVVIKEWELIPGAASSRIAFVADRYVSGDPGVRFMPRAEIDDLVAAALPGWEKTTEGRIPPRKANLLLTYRRPLQS